MGASSNFDPSFWYVINHRYNHLVYRTKDRAKAKAYALSRNKAHLDESEYGVISGSQLMVRGVDTALRSPSFG